MIILECDEHQHRDRTCECEQTRMVNIAQVFGGTPVCFIRFNPDEYSPYDDSQDITPINKRYELVGDLIEEIMKNKAKIPAALASVIYLYYDGWSSIVEEEWKVLLQFESRISYV